MSGEFEFRPVSIGELARRYPAPDTDAAINADVTWNSGQVLTIEQAKARLRVWGADIGVIYMRFGDWCVTDTGIDCLCCPYFIEADRIHEAGWHLHMAEKTWVNMFDFCRALEAARKQYPPKPKRRFSTGRRGAGFRLTTEEKEVLKKHRDKKQLRRARRLLDVRQRTADLSAKIEGLENE